MFKVMKKRLRNEKGLTLIELLAVIVILAIITAIAIPSISGIIEKQRDKAALADAARIINSAKLAHADGACEETAKTEADSSKTKCSVEQLENYLEIQGTNDFKGTDTVERNGADWTITWAAAPTLNRIKITRASTDIGISGATEKEILRAMGK